MNGTTIPDKGFFGAAAHADEMFLVARNTALFGAMHLLFETAAPRMMSYKTLKNQDSKSLVKIAQELNSLFHAAVCSLMCLYALAFPDGDFIENKLYGSSPLVSFIFAFSVGYFVWDGVFMLKSGTVEPAFIGHHLCGILVYTFTRWPFMQYHALCCLLYEISTPFLCMRTILLLCGMKGTRILGLVEKLFAASFISCRIIFGLPVSVSGMIMGASAMINGQLLYPSHFVLILLANVVINSLNLFWLTKILKMAIKPTCKVE